MSETMNKEEIALLHGWKKYHGYIIDNSMICEEYDATLIPMDQAKETIREGDFWLSEDGPGYEDIGDVMDEIEDEICRNCQYYSEIVDCGKDRDYPDCYLPRPREKEVKE